MPLNQNLTLQNGEVVRHMQMNGGVLKNIGVLNLVLFIQMISSVNLTMASDKTIDTQYAGELELTYDEEKATSSTGENENIDKESSIAWSVELAHQLTDRLVLTTSFSGESGAKSDSQLDEFVFRVREGDSRLDFGYIESVYFSSQTEFNGDTAVEYMDADAVGVVLEHEIHPGFSLAGYGFQLDQSNFAETTDTSNLSGGVLMKLNTKDEDVSGLFGVVSDVLSVDSELAGTTVPTVFGRLEWNWLDWALLFEHTSALSSHDDAENNLGKPVVSMLEILYSFGDSNAVGLRLEKTRQLFEEPESRTGIIYQRSIIDSVLFSLEYQESRFSSKQEELFEKKRSSSTLLSAIYEF